MIYVYCRRGSDSARALSTELGGLRLRNFDGMRFWRKGKHIKFEKNDCIVAWGDALPDIPNVHILNGAETPNKFDTAQKFVNSGIPTIVTYMPTSREITSRNFYASMIGQNYLPRMNNHIGGNDLLNPPLRPDFWVLKNKINAEYRIHSFGGKSIRAGIKKIREGYTFSDAEVAANPNLKRASDWIRSYDGGWRIVYDGFKSNEAVREIAAKAVQALGLTFGAVDIAKLSEGKYIVLEVNRAPGLEGNSVTRYAEAIKEWANEVTGVSGGSVEGGEGLRPEREQNLEQPVPEADRFIAAVPFTDPYDVPGGEAPGVQPEQPAPAIPNLQPGAGYRTVFYNGIQVGAIPANINAYLGGWVNVGEAGVPEPNVVVPPEAAAAARGLNLQAANDNGFQVRAGIRRGVRVQPPIQRVRNIQRLAADEAAAADIARFPPNDNR